MAATESIEPPPGLWMGVPGSNDSDTSSGPAAANSMPPGGYPSTSSHSAGRSAGGAWHAGGGKRGERGGAGSGGHRHFAGGSRNGLDARRFGSSGESSSSSVARRAGPDEGNKGRCRPRHPPAPGAEGAARLRRHKWINRQVTRVANSGNMNRLLQTIQYHISEMNAINIATALHRVTRLAVSGTEGLSVDWLLKQPSFLLLRATVVQQIRAALEPHDESGESGEPRFEVQCMSIVCWSCATLRLHEEKMMANIAEIAIPRLWELKPFELSNMVWAYAKLAMGTTALYAAVSKRMVNRSRSEFSLQCLSMIAWSFATARVKDADLFASLAQEISANAGSAKPQEIANTLWAYAKNRCAEVPLFNALANAAIEGDLLWTFKPQELSNTVWAFATAGLQHPALFRHAVPVAISKRRELSPQNSANILWAYAKLQVCRRSGLFPALLSVSVGTVPQHKPQEISAIVWAAAREDYGACRRFFWTTAQVCSERLREFPPQALANMIEAFAVIGANNPTFSEAMAHESVGRLHQFEPLALSNLFRGVVLVARRRPAAQGPSAAASYERHDTALDAIAGHISQRLGELQDADLSHVSHSLQILGPLKKEHGPGTAALLLALPPERQSRRQAAAARRGAASADPMVGDGEESGGPSEADAAAGNVLRGGYDDLFQSSCHQEDLQSNQREQAGDGDSLDGVGAASDASGEDNDGSSVLMDIPSCSRRLGSDDEQEGNPTATCEGQDTAVSDGFDAPGPWSLSWGDEHEAPPASKPIGGGRAGMDASVAQKPPSGGRCSFGGADAFGPLVPGGDPWRPDRSGTEPGFEPWGGSALPPAQASPWASSPAQAANGIGEPWPPWRNPWAGTGQGEGASESLFWAGTGPGALGPGAPLGAGGAGAPAAPGFGAAGAVPWPAAPGPWSGGFPPVPVAQPPRLPWQPPCPWPQEPSPYALGAGIGFPPPGMVSPLAFAGAAPQQLGGCGSGGVGGWKPRRVAASCLVLLGRGAKKGCGKGDKAGGQECWEQLDLQEHLNMAVVGVGDSVVRLKHGIMDERVVVKRMADGPASWPTSVSVHPHLLAPCAEIVANGDEDSVRVGDCYLAYRHCEHGTLAEWIMARRAEGKAASLEDSARIVGGVIAAASALICAGVGVSAIRADEIFVDSSGEPHVRIRHDKPFLASQGSDAAKWLAPEEVFEGNNAGWPAAAFRIGLLLHCLGCGIPDPYPHKRGELVLLDLRREVSGEGRPLRPDASLYRGAPALRELMKACLSQWSAERPSEQELLEAVERAVADAEPAGRAEGADVVWL